MARKRVWILAGAVAAFLIGAGLLIASGGGGGGHAVTIDLRISGSSMSPAAPQARRGDRVTLRVTADAKEEIHLHGYDLTFEIDRPGVPVTRTFTADRTGTFEIEIETRAQHLGDLTVGP